MHLCDNIYKQIYFGDETILSSPGNNITLDGSHTCMVCKYGTCYLYKKVILVHYIRTYYPYDLFS